VIFNLGQNIFKSDRIGFNPSFGAINDFFAKSQFPGNFEGIGLSRNTNQQAISRT
jgi:hypothetical protein